MDWEIGEIKQIKGEWYQCVEGNGCADCAFYEKPCNRNPLYETIGSCRHYRKDATSVIFKFLEKVGEPYRRWLSPFNSIMVQRYRLYGRNVIMPDEPYMYFNAIDNTIEIELKQTKEDMEEKYKAENTPLTRLVGRYVNNLIDYDVFEKAVKELYTDKEESKPNLKPFDLEAAKAGNPVCTRDGRKARIICFDKQEGFPIIALVETKVNDRISEEIALFNINGRAVSDDIDSKLDLMMSPEKKEGWVNVYKGSVCISVYPRIYKSREEAVSDNTTVNRIDTVKISWEE